MKILWWTVFGLWVSSGIGYAISLIHGTSPAIILFVGGLVGFFIGVRRTPWSINP